MYAQLPFYLHRQRLLRRRDLAVAALAGALLAVVLILSIYPPPPRPYSFVIYVLLGSVVAGVVMSRFVRSRSAAAVDLAPEADAQGGGVPS